MSTACCMQSRLTMSAFFIVVTSYGTWILTPRNLMDLIPMKRMGSPASSGSGLISFPIEPVSRDCGTCTPLLSFLTWSTMPSRCWQAAGESARKQVLPAYCSTFTGWVESENLHPRSSLVCNESTMQGIDRRVEYHYRQWISLVDPQCSLTLSVCV